MLRRTPFRRKEPPPSLARVREWHGAMPSPRSPASPVPVALRAVLPLLKEAPLRSEPYRRYVAAQECFGCQLVGFSQCAHPNEGKGMALKTDDGLSFPLCGPRPLHMGCHAMFDLGLDGEDREERRERARGYTARMRARAVLAGWFAKEEAP